MVINLKKFFPKKNLLTGKNILISGANSGIGREAAITFAQYGAKTILLGRNEKDLEKVYELIIKKKYPEPLIHTIDFEYSEIEDYIDIYKAIHSEYGRLDGLLNNASILGEKKSISQYSFSTWRSVMSINVDSVFLLTQSLLPLLELSDNASIIFTSANEGKIGKAYWGAYSVSKFATEGLMQILADELEHTSSIRVNSINPVAVKSKLRKKAFPAEDPNSVPLPKDFIKLYLYLISDLSKECKGKSIDVQIV